MPHSSRHFSTIFLRSSGSAGVEDHEVDLALRVELLDVADELAEVVQGGRRMLEQDGDVDVALRVHASPDGRTELQYQPDAVR